MIEQGLLSTRQSAAYLLILCFVVFTVSGILYTGRAIWQWPVGKTIGYLRWERGFVLAAVVLTVLGLVLLEDLLRAAGDTVIAKLGLATYLLAAAVVMVAEATFLNTRQFVYPQIIVYIVLAFLAQAAFGVSMLRTGLLAGWVGWATILWNLGWLVLLPLVSPRDLYYPVLHHTAPLLIGIMLLLKR
ncbi:MAG: hypothetical protein R3C14_03485 [Caldilineaceae bacterium]